MNALTSVLSLLNRIYKSNNIIKHPVFEFSAAWHHLQTIVSCRTNDSLMSSLAVVTLAVVIRHAPQCDISQLVTFTISYVISLAHFYHIIIVNVFISCNVV